MNDDLKERLKAVARCDTDSAMRHFAYAFMEQDPDGDYVTYAAAKARITDLEARLAAAVEVQDRLMSERYQQYLRAEAAEAGEDALAEALRITHERLMNAVHSEFDGVWSAEDFNEHEAEAVSALAAYEARRKG